MKFEYEETDVRPTDFMAITTDADAVCAHQYYRGHVITDCYPGGEGRNRYVPWFDDGGRPCLIPPNKGRCYFIADPYGYHTVAFNRAVDIELAKSIGTSNHNGEPYVELFGVPTVTVPVWHGRFWCSGHVMLDGVLGCAGKTEEIHNPAYGVYSSYCRKLSSTT